MTREITINVDMWEACRTPEEADAHAAECLKLAMEVDGKRRSIGWFCLVGCPASAPGVKALTGAQLNEARGKLIKGAT
jgi:hypothetical protein